MKLFIKLNFNGSGLEEMILERESNIGKSELLAYINQYKDTSYSLGDKKKAKYIYCYACDTTKHHALFDFDHKTFSYGIRPYCLLCAQLASKDRINIRQKLEQKARVQRKKALIILKKEKLIEEKRRKEEKQRQMLNNDKLYRAEQELYRYEYFHEHGEYPKLTKSDNNIIYVWKYDDMYKIGITSKRRGTGRIYDVAKSGNMRADILHYVEVDDARLIEKKLLGYGDPVRFDYKFDGSTEFRYLTDENLENIDCVINKYAKVY